MLTKGDNTVPMTVFSDYSSPGTALTGKRMQRPEHQDQAVLDKAVWGTDKWQEQLVTEIRYEVPQKACSCFCFEIETSNDFTLIGYSIELSAADIRTGRAKVV